MRQLALAEVLRGRSHTVTAITSGRATSVFADNGFPVLNGWMPMVIGRPDRLLASRIVRDNFTHAPSGLRTMVSTARALSRMGTPDLFLTDYEPNAAWLSYLLRRPLVSVDQQSKYRYLDLPVVDSYIRKVERQRLSLFMPRVTAAYVCSFMPLTAGNPKVTIIPPILADAVLETKPTIGPSSIAYFSAYFNEGPEVRTSQLIEAFRRLPLNRKLTVYLPPAAAASLRYLTGRNVTVRAVDRDSFLRDLAECDTVFCNAGFNLISEALHLGKPLYVCPLPTYDQQWCGQVIGDSELGESHSDCNFDDVSDFLERSGTYRKAIDSAALAEWHRDPRPDLVSALEAIAGTR